MLFWGTLAVVGFGGAIFAARAYARRKGGSMALDEAALRAIPGIDAGKLQIIRWMLDEWQRGGVLSADEQAALLAAAYLEGKFALRAVSPVGAPDDKGGRAWGTFQFLKTTLQSLGSSVEEVSPRNSTPAELERAARGSARVAVAFLTRSKPRWAGGLSYLDGIRALSDRDPFQVAREIFVAWNAGQSRRWADIEAVAPNPKPGSLGYVHYTVARKLKALPAFRAGLGLPAIPLQLSVEV